MNALKHLRTHFLTVVILLPVQVFAQSNSDATSTGLQQAFKERDGQHDFDFNIGTWKTHVSRLVLPLTGSTTWVEYEGVSVVRKVWNGRASLFELEVMAQRVTSKAWACVCTILNRTNGVSIGPTAPTGP
jgi:hypothetical protein